jgi:hypothetical protein
VPLKSGIIFQLSFASFLGWILLLEPSQVQAKTFTAMENGVGILLKIYNLEIFADV